jgi:hypothetical protein
LTSRPLQDPYRAHAPPPDRQFGGPVPPHQARDYQNYSPPIPYQASPTYSRHTLPLPPPPFNVVTYQYSLPHTQPPAPTQTWIP